MSGSHANSSPNRFDERRRFGGMPRGFLGQRLARQFHRPFFRDAEPFDPHIVDSLSDGFLFFWCQVAHEG